jgi:hypothetical protein
MSFPFRRINEFWLWRRKKMVVRAMRLTPGAAWFSRGRKHICAYAQVFAEPFNATVVRFRHEWWWDSDTLLPRTKARYVVGTTRALSEPSSPKKTMPEFHSDFHRKRRFDIYLTLKTIQCKNCTTFIALRYLRKRKLHYPPRLQQWRFLVIALLQAKALITYAYRWKLVR